MKKIAIFYHLLQVGDWKRIYKEQIERIQKSGLLDAAPYFHIGINGTEELKEFPINANITRNNNHQTEYETLKALFDFSCDNKDYAILYFNSLGASWSVEEFKNNLVSTPSGMLTFGFIGSNKNSWRKYLEYYNIDNWKTCLEELENYDCVGTELVRGGTIGNEDHDLEHFSGNFWWANAKYIASLNPNFMLDFKYDRFNCEFWICTNKPKCKSFFKFGINLYDNPIREADYIGESTMRKIRERLIPSKNSSTDGRICMISMFKNESKHIRKMLDSVSPYIDFWVLQDNGSTDGTPEIVNQWHSDTKIPGVMYTVEEGWVGFGWNRDHLLQRAKNTDHLCDWIMKMDCDEILQVDDSFNWQILNVDQNSSDAFDVYAEAPGCQYFRTWLWRADLPWRINHDPAHETVYLEDKENKNFDYTTKQLPVEFKMVAGQSMGESYSIPTKYVSDALKLEEKLIREQTMLSDNYHFWYIGKSYEDGYSCQDLPLKQTHQVELARRCIFYFEEVLAHTQPGYRETKNASHMDEMAYHAVISIGNCYRFLGEHYKAIQYYKRAEQFCPPKNDHLVKLAEIYWELLDFKKMLNITSRLVDPNRKNPFPGLRFLINPNWYADTGTHPDFLHSVALERSQVEDIGTVFAINNNYRKKLFVVDNFYEDPDLVRKYALQQEFNGDIRFYKGKRTIGRHSTPQIKQTFEKIIGESIVKWDSFSSEYDGSMNGVFQYCTPEDALVYHYDQQKWAAMVFLTPDAPVQTGTSFYKHKQTGVKTSDDPNSDLAFTGGFYDATKFELIDTVGNIYNRCVIFDARQIHAATEYFGQTKEDSRLFHIFFFD